MSEDLKLTKVDSAIAGLSISPKDDKTPAKSEKDAKKTHKRVASQSEGVWNIKDLGMVLLLFARAFFLFLAHVDTFCRGTKNRA